MLMIIENGKDHDDFVMIIVMLEQGPVGINVIINDHDNAQVLEGFRMIIVMMIYE